MRIVIPNTENRVSLLFDSASSIRVIDLIDGKISSQIEKSMKELSFFQRLNCLLSLRTETIICGAISRPLKDILISSGIKVVPWVKGEIPEILSAFHEGKLENSNFIMPGQCIKKRCLFRRGRNYKS